MAKDSESKRQVAGKSVISAAALVLIVTHLIRPEWTVDAVTLGLFAILVLPWLSFLFKSIELPGGIKVEYRDLQEAAEKIISTASPPLANLLAPQAAYMEIADRDPNLALVGLRIEIETRLRALGDRYGVRSQRSLQRLVDELRNRGALNDSAVSGLQELISAGNQAAHGAEVEPRAAQWALDYGPQILASLDARPQDAPAPNPNLRTQDKRD
jgi:hypothetical protein